MSLVVNNLIVEDGLESNSFSAQTIYSGSTELETIIDSKIQSSSSETSVQPGTNITTGGTASLPIINLVESPSVNNFNASGTSNFTGIIQSGGTDLYNIFLTEADGNDITRVQPGINILTGGTGNEPIISIVDSPSFNQITTSGSSTFAGANFTGAIQSGGTDLYDIFVTEDTSDITRVQPGSNITTGGTENEPIINLVDSPSVNDLSFSGTASGGDLFANNLSGGTIFSGSTDIDEIYHQKAGYLLQKSGIIAGSSFAGNPKKSTVTFTTPFSDDNYSVAISADINRTWTWESKTASGFTISANSNPAFNTSTVNWIALENGEGFK